MAAFVVFLVLLRGLSTILFGFLLLAGEFVVSCDISWVLFMIVLVVVVVDVIGLESLVGETGEMTDADDVALTPSLTMVASIM
jgi:hypothetical protein